MGRRTAALSAMLFAAHAAAQSAPSPVAVLPAGVATAPNTPPTGADNEPSLPLSARLLQIKPVSTFLAIPYEIHRGPYTFHGSELQLAVVGSPIAVGLAREASSKFGQGTGLLIGGSVTALAGLVCVIASAATYPQNPGGSTETSGILLGTSLGLVVVALAFDLVGAALVNEGIGKWFEAVNTYNRQLLDGQLEAVPSS